MTTVIILLVLGVILLVVDIAFVPGMVLGLLGAIMIVTGIVTAYITIGPEFGHITLIGSVVTMALMLVYFYKTDVWSKFALKDSIGSKVNEESRPVVEVGDIGKAISALRPSGKAEINGEIFEVYTLGDYCDAGKEVKIISITNTRICVEPV